VHFVTKVTFFKSPSKEDSFDTYHDHINEKNIPGLLGLGLKFEVVFGTGFLINFHATYNYKRRFSLCKTK
jgi:hypothetical protein